MNIQTLIAIVGVFLGGLWTGYIVFFASIMSPIGYEPCWSNLIDIRKEAQYQDSLGPSGWQYDDPQLKADCVLVDPRWRYKGYREMTPSERADHGR